MITMFRVKAGIKKSFLSKIGYLFMRKTFKDLKKTMDYNNHGGAVLLGCKKLVVKGHGGSKYTSIRECILQAYNMHKAGVVEKLEKGIIEFNESQTQVEE